VREARDLAAPLNTIGAGIPEIIANEDSI